MKQKIYFDISSAVHHRAGLGRYSESLAKAMLPLEGGALSLVYHHSNNSLLPGGLEAISCKRIPLGFRRWVVLVIMAHLAGANFDSILPDAGLYHATEHLLPPFKRIPTVLTVHDLFFRHPSYHKWTNRFYLNLAMPIFCRRATHIIAVSEHTKRDLMNCYNTPEDKITVIEEAAAAFFRPPEPSMIEVVKKRYRLPERYLLFVGTIEPRKNIIRLLRAFMQLHNERLTDGLVIVGRKGWLYEEFFQELQRSSVASAVIFPGYVVDEDLPSIYAGAQTFVYPSFAEGFGLPVLEAMSCGTPVVCSNSTCLPEVAGNAAVLVDPLDQEGLTAAIRQVVSSTALSDALRIQGVERSQHYSWERAARETWQVYQRLLVGTT